MRALEQRFPTLYHDVVNEYDPKTQKTEEKRTAKENPPSLHDVIAAVCSTHRVTDASLIKDLTATVTEFTAPPPEPAAEKKKKATKESE